MTSKLGDPTRHIDRAMDSDPDDDDVKLSKPIATEEPKDEKFALNLNASRYISSPNNDRDRDRDDRNGGAASGSNKYFDMSNNNKSNNLADLLTRARQNGERAKSDDDDRDRRDYDAERLEERDRKMSKMTKILLHPAMIGLYAAILIFILLVSIQPAFIMKSVPLNARTEELAEPTQQHMLSQRKKINWSTVTVITLLTGLIVGLTPFLVQVITTSIKKKQQRNREKTSDDHDKDNDSRDGSNERQRSSSR
jgi:hypothetical protein